MDADSGGTIRRVFNTYLYRLIGQESRSLDGIGVGVSGEECRLIWGHGSQRFGGFGLVTPIPASLTPRAGRLKSDQREIPHRDESDAQDPSQHCNGLA